MVLEPLIMFEVNSEMLTPIRAAHSRPVTASNSFFCAFLRERVTFDGSVLICGLSYSRLVLVGRVVEWRVLVL